MLIACASARYTFAILGSCPGHCLRQGQSAARGQRMQEPCTQEPGTQEGGRAMTPDADRIVDGATRIYCIVGDPIVQVGSPRVFTERFRAAGRNAILVPFQVLSAAFDETIRGIKAI